MDEHPIASAPQGRGYSILNTGSKAFGGRSLGEFAGTGHARFTAGTGLDRGPHWPQRSEAAAVPDHTLFCDRCAFCAADVGSEYLKRLRGEPVHWRDVFRHFHCFAATILDRVYLLRGKFERFDVTVHGKEILHRQIESSRGSILLGSHLGSFEVLRALGVMERSVPLKVLMDTLHNQNISRFFDALNPTVAGTVIAPDRPDTLIRVKESLDAGCFIGMLGDRVSGGDKTTQCQFLRRRRRSLLARAACRHHALPCDFGFWPATAAQTATKFISNILLMRSLWIAIIAPKTFSSGCSATPSAWSITRVLRLTTGLTSIRFGIRRGSYSYSCSYSCSYSLKSKQCWSKNKSRSRNKRTDYNG